MDQEQIQKTVEEVIRLLSEINQKTDNQKCQLSPALQKEINEAGLLRSSNLTPNLDTIKEAVPFIRVREKFGDFSKIEYYCFVPNRFPNNVGYRLFGIDGGRNTVVFFEDFPSDIYDSAAGGGKIDYAFLISAK
jgi:hypothetical protein